MLGAWGIENGKKINPSIVYVSLTGYGQGWHLQNEAGHDFTWLILAS
ncbi:MAG: hypothetical protein R2788_27365 [Saprospiraceae bacterium]